MKLLVVIPTYNEIENIEELIRKVFYLNIENLSVLVVDDASPDGTSMLVENLRQKFPKLYILNRPAKSGLASAYIQGFEWGIDNGFDTFLEMDADLSHSPEYITQMIEQIENYDVVIGSRFVKGGSCENGSLQALITKIGSFVSRLILGCPIKDLTGGYNMWRLSALEKINLNKIISKGYSFQAEMKYRAYKAGCSFVEIPIKFMDRKSGQSKMSSNIFFEALVNLFRIKFKV